MRNNEIAETVTAAIVDSLSKGEIPWVKPWVSRGLNTPVNITTGKNYRGVNTMLLWVSQAKGNFPVSRWLTFKQARAAGGCVRKGEKGTTVIFWKFLDKEDKTSGEKSKIPLFRSYTVFNVSQCDGLPEKFAAVEALPPITGENEEVEAFIHSTGANISHQGDQAGYSPIFDKIVMPEPGQFVDMGSYYATVLHELIHWTGNSSRCKRHLGERFGTESYAAEELVAEIGSAFLCAEFGIQGKLQHDAYVQNWIKVLNNDKQAVFAASRMAQEAVDYLMRNMPKATAESPEENQETQEE